MYVLKKKDGYVFFYGFDNQYHPPRILTSKVRKRLTYYKTLEEAQQTLKRIGNRFEIVQLRVVHPEDERR